VAARLAKAAKKAPKGRQTILQILKLRVQRGDYQAQEFIPNLEQPCECCQEEEGPEAEG
jgi:hypothetical protein